MLTAYTKTLGDVYARPDLTVAWQATPALAREIDRLQQSVVSPATPLPEECADRIVAVVRGYRDGRPAEYLVSGDVRVTGSGFRAARTLRSGTVLAREDIVVEDGAIPPSASFKPGVDAEGLYLSQGVGAGQWVLRQNLREAPLVRRGEMMLVVYLGTGIELRGHGVARRDAWLGERVVVRLEGAGRDCEARVVGPGRAQIGANAS